jgi:hypothetical protein
MVSVVVAYSEGTPYNGCKHIYYLYQIPSERSKMMLRKDLVRDAERQRTVQHNAQILALRDAESQSLRIAESGQRLRQTPFTTTTTDTNPALPSEMKKEEDKVTRNPLPKRSFKGPRLPSTPDADYVPQSWSPLSVRRRQANGE